MCVQLGATGWLPIAELELPMVTPVGLEPTIPGSVGRCLIHWATGPAEQVETPDCPHRKTVARYAARVVRSALNTTPASCED